MADLSTLDNTDFTNFITMTPGTLGLVVSDDHHKLYIHAMYLDHSPEKIAEQLLNDHGKRVKRAI